MKNHGGILLELLVDLTAPGVGVYSTVIGGYDTFDGTSMATPHVAGMAALYLEAEPMMTASELWDKLKSSTRPSGEPADFGAGFLRLHAQALTS